MGYFDDMAKEKAAKALQETTLRQSAKRLAGHPVKVERLKGDPIQGDLVSVTPRSVWLVVGGRDEMIPFGEVAGIHPPYPAA